MMALAGAWGYLPLAIPAMAFLTVRLGSIVFPDNAAHRIIAGSALSMALLISGVRLLGTFHLVTPMALLVGLAFATVAVAIVHRKRRFDLPWREALSMDVLPLVVVTCGALGATLLAARWLPIWHWDSVGYHLPYVNFFLLGRGQDAVPPDIEYISSYPHNVETYFVALRAMLPDDRLLDLGQIPLGIMGAVATAGVARLLGAPRPVAVAAGCAWLLVPTVFLQLPSNYVDVGSAAFLLSAVYFALVPPTTRTVLVAGIALGLFLGSKPNAPVGTLLVGSILVVRGARARISALPFVAVAVLVALLGSESYVQNWLLHGNPVWPVRLALGPLKFPGSTTLDEILATAPALPRVHGPLLIRTLLSWATLWGGPVTFDMRMGGLGPLFLVCLPCAVATLVQQRSVALALATLATLASPEPAWARFILAFAAMVFALATPQLARLENFARRRGWSWASRSRTVALTTATMLGLWQLGYSWSGLAGEGPPLLAYANMSDDQRLGALGPVGRPTNYIEARKRIRDDETFAFDIPDELPYLGWETNLRYRVIAIPRHLTYDQVQDFLQRENVRVLVAADDRPAGQWAKSHSDHFAVLFRFSWVPCSAYERF